MEFPWPGRRCTEGKSLAPTALIAISTLFVVIITFVALSLGITIIFQNAYYIPIILACYYWRRKGLYFSIVLVLIYLFSLLAVFPSVEIFYQGLIRVLFFLFIAAIVTYLSEAITREKSRYQGIFYNSESGILLFERDSGRITEANPEVPGILGYPVEELTRMKVSDIFLDRGQVEAFLAGKEGAIRHREADTRHSDGTHRTVTFSSAWIDATTGMVTLQDVTEKKRAEEAISLSNRKLNLLNSITRHDILNTLTALLGYLELSKEVARDEEVRKYIDSSTRAAETIRRQIEFTRDYQDVGVRSPDWSSIHALVGNQNSRPKKRHQVEIDLPDIQVYADPLVEKVFYNPGGELREAWRKSQQDLVSAEKEGNDLGHQVLRRWEGYCSGQERRDIQPGVFPAFRVWPLFVPRDPRYHGDLHTGDGDPGKGAVFELVVPPGSYRTAGKGE